jgi:hypothetical protein
MTDHMRAQLVGDELRMAIESRRPAPRAMYNSDRGTEGNTPRPSSPTYSLS